MKSHTKFRQQARLAPAILLLGIAVACSGAGSQDPLAQDKSEASVLSQEQFMDFCTDGGFTDALERGLDQWEVSSTAGEIDELISGADAVTCRTTVFRLDIQRIMRVQMTHIRGTPPTESQLEEDAVNLPDLDAVDAYIGSDGLLWLEFFDTDTDDPSYSQGDTEVKHYLNGPSTFVRVSLKSQGEPTYVAPTVLHRAAASVTSALVERADTPESSSSPSSSEENVMGGDAMGLLPQDGVWPPEDEHLIAFCEDAFGPMVEEHLFAMKGWGVAVPDGEIVLEPFEWISDDVAMCRVHYRTADDVRLSYSVVVFPDANLAQSEQYWSTRPDRGQFPALELETLNETSYLVRADQDLGDYGLSRSIDMGIGRRAVDGWIQVQVSTQSPEVFSHDDLVDGIIDIGTALVGLAHP